MSPRFTSFFAAILAIGAAIPQPLPAQEPDKDSPAPEVPKPKESKTISTITKIRNSINEVTGSLKAANQELGKATTDAEKAELTKKIDDLTETKARLNRELQEVITGIDIERFNNPSGQELDLAIELQEFLRPILTELKDVTAKPRELENLRGLISYHQQRLDLAEKAVTQISSILADAEDPDLKSALTNDLKNWEESRLAIESDLSVAKFRLEEAENTSQSVFGTITKSFTDFARTRGRNLLFALVIGIAVFLLLRLAHRLLHKLPAFKKRGNRSFGIRLIEVAYYLFNIFAAAIAALLTLYVAGDWIMLGLFIIIIVGIIWTGKPPSPSSTNRRNLC